MNRHRLRRSLAALLLAGGLATGTLAGAGGSQALAPASGYHHWHHRVEGRVVSPAPLRVHYGPATGRWVTGTISNGMHVWIRCQADGSDVGGNHRWYRLTGGQGWIPAYYVHAFHHVPWCGD